MHLIESHLLKKPQPVLSRSKIPFVQLHFPNTSGAIFTIMSQPSMMRRSVSDFQRWANKRWRPESPLSTGASG